MKNIIILNCGPGLPEVRNEFGIAVAWIQREIDSPKFKFTSMDVYDGEMPNYDDGDAWIITGASESVYDDLDWIVELEEAIKKAIEVEKPILGICFGHQLIAQAMGGKVERNSKGWELGAYPMSDIADHHLFNNIDANDFFYNSHQDIVADLPNGFVSLAQNKMGNQAFYYGKRIYGVQFHPEFTHSIMKKYVEVRQSMGATVIDSTVPESKSSHLIINNFLKIV
ncbi:MAG: type 1 glutamine amidotransferase [Candidatus Marinimicrobia bacterium]|nr:type 1 glutamine amidotransferase [Candidatus Neomarinimicrobiota bacterium]